MRLHTCANLANDATSRIATSLKMWTSISSGMAAIGHGGAGIPSIAGGVGSIIRSENPAMSCLTVCGDPSREWWAVLGTVTEAFEGFGFGGFEAKYEGGKCFCLYI